MRLIRHAGAADFLETAEPFLLANEAENSLILGIARSHAGGVGSPGAMFGKPEPDRPPYFATVSDDTGVALAAFRTLPRKLGLTRALRDDATVALAGDVEDACPQVDEVLGPEPTIARFAATLAALRGTTPTREMDQLIYALTEVTPPRSWPPGRLRAAEVADDPTLIPWARGFLDAMGDEGDPVSAVGDRRGNGQLYVWDDAGPRSMACWTGKTPNGVRVGFVYTPPELRGHGYASAVVAALSGLLLQRGNSHCVLYTDAANPTSNAIYQRIGYRQVADAAVYRVPVSRRP